MPLKIMYIPAGIWTRRGFISRVQKRGQKSHRFQLMCQGSLKIGQRERHVWMRCFWSKNPSATAVCKILGPHPTKSHTCHPKPASTSFGWQGWPTSFYHIPTCPNDCPVTHSHPTWPAWSGSFLQFLHTLQRLDM
jgi:hypothetical protein